MHSSTNLTPKQVSYLRGRLKARKRSEKQESRYAKFQIDTEQKRQEKLAREISRAVGDLE